MLAEAHLFSGDSRKKIFGFTSPDVSKSTPFFRRQPEENFWFYIP
jgi:hypothetical protein